MDIAVHLQRFPSSRQQLSDRRQSSGPFLPISDYHYRTTTATGYGVSSLWALHKPNSFRTS